MKMLKVNSGEVVNIGGEEYKIVVVRRRLKETKIDWKNPDEVRERNRNYMREYNLKKRGGPHINKVDWNNPEAVREYRRKQRKEWAQKNKEKIKEFNKKYYLKRKNKKG